MHYHEFCDRFFVSRETFEKLECYQALLLKWQRRINLISPNTVADIWQRHILDSCQLYPLIKDKAGRVVDLGSGAGLPGIILAILGCSDIHLVESDTRKCQFLKESSREIGLDILIHNDRIEKTSLGNVAYITARALKSLDQLLNWSRHLLTPSTICLFPKGKNYAKELEDVQRLWQFKYEIMPSTIDESGIVLIVKQIQPR